METTRFDIRIDRSAADCFAGFAAVERTTDWLPDVRSARSRDFDEAGRPSLVDFMASAQRGGLIYTLSYAYAPQDYTVSWRSADDRAVRFLQGRVSFAPQTATSCQMHYETKIALAETLPAWVGERYRERSAAALCQAFKAWMEQKPSKEGVGEGETTQ